MKKIFLFIVLIQNIILFAQAPQKMSYQSVVRNANNSLVANQVVGVRISFIEGSEIGAIVYSETHTVTTNANGLFTLGAGSGTAVFGTFASINWSSYDHYIKSEIDPSGGTNYTLTSTKQLLSVPYALYANNSGNGQSTTPNLATVLAVNNSANNTKIVDLLDPTNAQDAVTKLYTDTLVTQLQTQITNLQAQITALQTPVAAALPSVQIGSQIWQNINLDVPTYRDGTPIPEVTDPNAWANLTTGAWCYYNNDPTNNAVYGKLYNWYAVAGIHDNDPNTPDKFLAPTGWHIPTDAEWTTLTTFLGGTTVSYNGPNINVISYVGVQLKSTGTLLWQSPNTGATNSSGFNGLPGGYRGDNNTAFYNVNQQGFWWSRTNFGQEAWNRSLNYDNNDVYRNYGFSVKINGYSVRCVKD